MIIAGAGLAGLLAASQFPNAYIIDKSTDTILRYHKAVLRFRSSAIGDVLGIEFEPVTVYKSIYYKGKAYDKPSPAFMNLYSQKVSGAVIERSIRHLDTVQRWIAPLDFHESLIQRFRSRIHWGESLESVSRENETIISTIPLPSVLDILEIEHDKVFNFLPITVLRLKIPKAKVYQTIYYPDNATNIYRASITGDLLIIEAIGNEGVTDEELFEVLESFGIESIDSYDHGSQEFGKIKSIDPSWRRKMVYTLTKDYRIYSLGRFATWNNILLDHVLMDIYKIKKLIQMDSYQLKGFNHGL